MWAISICSKLLQSTQCVRGGRSGAFVEQGHRIVQAGTHHHMGTAVPCHQRDEVRCHGSPSNDARLHGQLTVVETVVRSAWIGLENRGSVHGTAESPRRLGRMGRRVD